MHTISKWNVLSWRFHTEKHEIRASLPALPLHTFTASLTAEINLAASSCMFSTGTHPCGPRILCWFHEQIKFSATSFAAYIVTQEMQNIVTGQTTITKGDKTEILSKNL